MSGCPSCPNILHAGKVANSGRKHRLVTDLSECRLLWERFIPRQNIWDEWDFRSCFHQHFQRPACFIVSGQDGEATGFLPLSWVEEAGCYQYFPGETWANVTWIEQNRIVADNDAMLQSLLAACPGPYHLRYLLPNPAVPMTQKIVDEVGYRFSPPQYAYDMQMYFQEFSGKSGKRLWREMASFEPAGIDYRSNVLTDFEWMMDVNRKRFGVRSYFHDPRFLASFRSLLLLAQERGWLRLTGLCLGGDLAAVDLGVVFNGAYTLLAGGTHTGYPGVAKLINLHHMQKACTERYLMADFLCGDFSWKKIFHLEPRPLYLLSNASFRTAGYAGPQAPAEQKYSMKVSRGLKTGRVLVIGTTVDYIELIHLRFPGRAVFITDPAERGAREPFDHSCEVLCDLSQPQVTLDRIRCHLAQHGLKASGVACFDCESMLLASFIAKELSLPYPSDEAVTACRSKFIAKQRWLEAGLVCPVASLIDTADDAVRFFEHCHGRRLVLKPLTGSGSELVFVCSTVQECLDAIDVMLRCLANPINTRMYAPYEHEGQLADPRRTVLIEELVAGTEYSCDFIIDGARIEVIRIARKWPDTDLAAGTIMAYGVPETAPGMAGPLLEQQLRTAAQAVGIERAICMLDFVMSGNRMTLLEIAPRPGGDCLPELIRSSSGLDMLGMTLDFAGRRPIAIPPPAQWRHRVGLRFFTPHSGRIAAIDADQVRRDPRVLEVKILRQPGHLVFQPPEDFDSRLLGHAIFQPGKPEAIESDCREISAKLDVKFAAD